MANPPTDYFSPDYLDVLKKSIRSDTQGTPLGRFESKKTSEYLTATEIASFKLQNRRKAAMATIEASYPKYKYKPFLDQQLIDMLQYKIPEEDILRLKSGDYEIHHTRDPMTLDAKVVVTDGKKTIHSLVISNDLLNSFTDEKPMSNKFLPFVVESSTPVNIFKILLTRSKGMNRVTLASIFNMTLNEDVTKLRKFAKELPEMQLEAMYEEMMTKWPQYRINEAILRRFEFMIDSLTITDHVDKKLHEFSHLDIMMFLYCLCSNTDALAEYTDIRWWEIIDLTEVYLNLQDYILLSDNAEQTVNVDNEVSLDAFIAYAAIIKPQITPSEEPQSVYNITYKQRSEE